MTPRQRSSSAHWLTFLALVVLVTLMLGLSLLDLGAARTGVLLGLAAVQAGIVVLCFMRVRENTQLVRIFALAGFFWLAILFTFVLSEFLTRRWL